MEQTQTISVYSVQISREDTFHLRAEIMGAEKNGSRSGHGKGKDEALGNLGRINPERFGTQSHLLCVKQIRANSPFYQAYMVQHPEIASDNKKGHKSPDAAIGSMMRTHPEHFHIKEITHHGL